MQLFNKKNYKKFPAPLVMVLPSVYLAVAYPLLGGSFSSFFGILFVQILSSLAAQSAGLFFGAALDLSASVTGMVWWNVVTLLNLHKIDLMCVIWHLFSCCCFHSGGSTIRGLSRKQCKKLYAFRNGFSIRNSFSCIMRLLNVIALNCLTFGQEQ